MIDNIKLNLVVKIFDDPVYCENKCGRLSKNYKCCEYLDTDYETDCQLFKKTLHGFLGRGYKKCNECLEEIKKQYPKKISY